MSRYIREIDPHESVAAETEMQPLIGALINNIQQGLEGEEEEEEEDEIYSFKKPASSQPGLGEDGGEASGSGDEPVDGDYTE